MNNLILIGFMGCGKSSTGIILAPLLKYNFVDTDLEIEKLTGLSIPDIFKIYGEQYFRKLEHQVIKKFINKKNNVISTGGGLPIFYNNSQILKRIGKIFYLKISYETFIKRTKDDTNRPLKNKKYLFYKRLPIYKKVADFTLNCDYRTPEEIALQIKYIYENNCR